MLSYSGCQYGLAEDTLRSGGSGSPKDVSPNELYSQSAIYIAAAHALKPNYSVCIIGFLFVQFLFLLSQPDRFHWCTSECQFCVRCRNLIIFCNLGGGVFLTSFDLYFQIKKIPLQCENVTV